jgi:hypothetical protein
MSVKFKVCTCGNGEQKQTTNFNWTKFAPDVTMSNRMWMQKNKCFQKIFLHKELYDSRMTHSWRIPRGQEKWLFCCQDHPKGWAELAIFLFSSASTLSSSEIDGNEQNLLTFEGPELKTVLKFLKRCHGR